MPPKTKITKEMILDAGFEIVQSEGIEKLTVRALSEKLGCSTQPILYQYSSIEEVKQAVYEKADHFHSRFIMPQEQGKRNPLMEIGLNYVRFGYEEKKLFQFLFQSNKFSGQNLTDLIESPELESILKITAAAADIGLQEAKEMFLSLFITAHGCASLLAGNAMKYEEEQIENLLTGAFRAGMTGGNRQ